MDVLILKTIGMDEKNNVIPRQQLEYFNLLPFHKRNPQSNRGLIVVVINQIFSITTKYL